MVELDAVTHLTPPLGAGAEHRRTFALDPNEPVWLGRSAELCTLVVPEDTMISRRHARLEWDGAVLVVALRTVVEPAHAPSAMNNVWYQNKPVDRCAVRPGEWFVIGQTRFTLREEVAPDLIVFARPEGP